MTRLTLVDTRMQGNVKVNIYRNNHNDCYEAHWIECGTVTASSCADTLEELISEIEDDAE